MKRKRTESSDFVDLVHRHQGILHRICSVYASSPEDREDLCQEMIMQSWKSFASFNGKSKFSTWLYRVALNTALLRTRKAAGKRGGNSVAGLEADVATEKRSDAADDTELLYDCIQELPTLNRAIILLHLEQHTYDEIAQITGLSRSNISVRLVRIKDRLRQMLHARGYSGRR
jgi:RNA polymerase sigma-70 factor (ECF subfamily)